MEERRLSELHKSILTGQERTYDKGQLIQSSDFHQSVCLVKEGYVKRYLITNDGNIGVQSIYGPGMIFPLTWVYHLLFDYSLYDGPETYYYEAMCSTTVYVLPNKKLEESLKNNPTLYKDLLFVAGQRLKSNIMYLENISMSNSYHRVAHLLVDFANSYGQPSKQGVKIMIPLTQQDIADNLGATRETISVSVSKLRKKGLIKTGKSIIIPDIKKLEREAYSLNQ